MIRKVVIAVFLIAGLSVAGLWATSYYLYDRWGGDPPNRLRSFVHFSENRQKCWYITSLDGSVRLGTVHVRESSGQLPGLHDGSSWVWFGSLAFPDSTDVKGGFARLVLGRALIAGRMEFDSGEFAGFAVPYWLLIALLLLTYPASALIWRPIQRRRRRKRGLCGSCGYNLTGNESGVCSECGTKVGRQ